MGERFEIIQTKSGNIMWDMVALLDQPTVDKVIMIPEVERVHC